MSQKISPCCCISLQTGTIIVAVINIVFSLIFMVYFGFGAIIGLVFKLVGDSSSNRTITLFGDVDEDGYSNKNSSFILTSNENTGLMSFIGTLILVISLIIVLLCLINFIFAIILIVGAKTRNAGKCWAWYVMTLIILLIVIIVRVVEIVFSGIQHSKTEEASENPLKASILHVLPLFLPFLFSVLFFMYELWVVYAFVREIKMRERGNENGTEMGEISRGNLTQNEPVLAPLVPPPYESNTTSPSKLSYSQVVKSSTSYTPTPSNVRYPVLPQNKGSYAPLHKA